MSGNSKIPEHILDDLSSRFIINIPKHERTGLNRISFQIELAHWFYLDYYCVQNSQLRPYKLKEFFYYIFQHIPFLKKYEDDIESIYTEWRDYKLMVPTFGAVLLDDTLSNILLVQSYMATSWGFPKGKINQEEDPVVCAVREVFEETGIDISKLINANDYIESTIHDQLMRLYFIVGIDKNTSFEPQTRCEIKAMKWFPIEQLPVSKKDNISKSRTSETRFFYMVIPFMRRILNWIEDRRRRGLIVKNNKKAERSRNKSCSEGDHSNNGNKFKKQTQNQVEKRKSQPVKPGQPERIPGNVNYLKNELYAAEELQQSFENSSPEVKLSRRKKLRNIQRALNKKTRPADDNLDLLSQLENGCERWKNFRFDRDRIISHLYC